MTNKRSKFWNITLWILQVVFGGMFIMAGFMKVTQPIETLAANMTWAADAEYLVRFIGLIEFLGG